jgi:hypothetical protein
MSGTAITCPAPAQGDERTAPQSRARLLARQKELEELQLQLEQERTALKRELGRRIDEGPARAHVGEVNRRIAEDRQGFPAFARASQNVAATAALLEALPVAATSEEQ